MRSRPGQSPCQAPTEKCYGLTFPLSQRILDLLYHSGETGGARDLLSGNRSSSRQPKPRGADASHAWVSFFCPSIGWLDVDPTNNCLPSLRHVTIGWGRDYGDVSPIRGVLVGGQNQTLRVSVDVNALGPWNNAKEDPAVAANMGMMTTWDENCDWSSRTHSGAN